MARLFFITALIPLLVCCGLLTDSAPGVPGAENPRKARSPQARDNDDDDDDHKPKERVYFVGIVERDWNYSPDLRNEVTGKYILPDSPEAKYVMGGDDRIGAVYMKALYREFTDDSYSTEVDRPEWLGFQGPTFYGEVGDTILIHTKNMASRPYTLHPHGVFYKKDSEGATYEDNTSGKDKEDDAIPAGASHTYRWEVPERAGPADLEHNCIPWMYHSHVESTFGMNSGLTGFMLICNPGILDENNKRTDVDRDFVLMFTVTDENLSYYLDDNIQRFVSAPVDPEDEDFMESNRMDSVNGFLYGALPGLDVCQGDTVSWHIMGIGTEIDIHTINFHGNVLEFLGHRVDTLSLTPAAIATGKMHASNPGTWLAKSYVVTHKEAGAQVLYRVDPECAHDVDDDELKGKTREYFIAAVEELWNYGPTGINPLDLKSLTDPDSASYQYFTGDDNRINGTYMKARYVEYTDESFIQRVPRPASEDYLGVLGPVIRAERGDTIKVTFKNLASQDYSIHPRGVLYDKANEGMTYNDGTEESEQHDGAVAPGDSYVYIWTIPESFEPTENDESCITMLYTSAADDVRDMYSGLVGPMLICKEKSLDVFGKQKDIDQEFILLFMIFDENLSWYLNDSIQAFAPNADPEDESFQSSNLMTSINGFSYANIPGLDVTADQTVRWHLAGLGKDSDQHTVYFHQSTFKVKGRRVSGVPIFPGTTQAVSSTADNAGTWLIECATNTHYTDGMTALYTVQSADGSTPDPASPARTYYIGAVEMEWDYTPDLYDPVRSQPLTSEDSPGYVFIHRGNTSIGSKYRKAVFRQFQSDMFVKQVRRTSDEDLSLGLLGPVIRAEVGEVVQVIFKNMATFPYSIHPEGLYTTKTDEGAFYGSSSESNRPVMPGETREYHWFVPESRGPTDDDRNCIESMYHSNVDREQDTNAGLVGPLVICRKRILNDEGRRKDIDKEFHLYFSVTDENKSRYSQQNIDHYCLTPDAVDHSDPDFEESNLMHGINGFLYNNLEHLEMKIGERVAWNLIALGDTVDLHTIHFHGQTVTLRTEHTIRLDVTELVPGVFVTVVMNPDDPGIWLLHCHVNDHILAGMETFFVVHEADPIITLPTTTCLPTTDGANIVKSDRLVLALVIIAALVQDLL